MLVRRTNRSSTRTCQPSVPRPVEMTAASSESLSRFRPSPSPRWAIRKATSGDRTIAWTLLGLMLPWLAYTRFYFWLQPRHLTFDGGLLMWLFNKPDPTCGLTRTFAWMWRGDLFHAVSVYPLGPLVFSDTIAAVAWALTVLVLGRAASLRLLRAEWRALIAVVTIALALNWASKLLWLGM